MATVEVGSTRSTSLGRITISGDAVAQIVGHTAAQCYGVVGMAARGGRVGRLLARDRLRQGIAVAGGPHGLPIDPHRVVQDGLNLAQGPSTIRPPGSHEGERLTPLTVAPRRGP